MFRNVTLKCLMEIAGVSLPEPSESVYQEKLLLLFMNTLGQLKQVLFYFRGFVALIRFKTMQYPV